jgi:hypothetical protein
VAKGVADRFGDGLVLRVIRLKKLPFLERMPHLTQRRGRFRARHIVRLAEHPMLPEYAFSSFIRCRPFHPRYLVEPSTFCIPFAVILGW